MKIKLIATIFCLGLAFSAFGQKTEQKPSDKARTEVSTKEISDRQPKEESPRSSASTEDQTQTSGYVRPNKKERFNRYVKSTVGLTAIAQTAARAGFSTITNDPEEWEKTGEGFGRRFASGMASNAIRQTTIYSLDEALKLDSKFYKSQKRDFGSRVKNAFLSTVTARNRNGKRVVGIPRIAGTYTSAIVSREVWYPERFNYKDGLRSGTISLGASAAFNLIREFF